jgi:ethanolamine utilization protein EutJ
MARSVRDGLRSAMSIAVAAPRARDKIDVGQFLNVAAKRYRSPAAEWKAPLRCGVDLGTATIVLTVVDACGVPIYLDWLPRRVVRDGVVVDFAGATAAVDELRQRAQTTLGIALDAAATAYPPGVGREEARACRFVLERAGLECHALVDEVSAAQALLDVRDGVIADVGGGSTGVGVIVNGSIVQLSDRPGAGYHLDLILAGALGIEVEEAEREKRNGDHLPILRPGVERIAESIRRQIGGKPIGAVHLVGGALMIPGAAEVVRQYLGCDVIEYPHALLITPFGIALS